MMQLLHTYAPALIAALLIGLVVAYWALRRSPATVIEAPPKAVEVAPPPTTAEPPPAGVPAPELAIPAAGGPPDDLQMMKGVGAKFAAQLNANGITRFDQIAALSMGDVADLDDRMGAFKGRLLRDRVIEQAIFLARDDRDGFESAFGKLGTGAPDSAS